MATLIIVSGWECYGLAEKCYVLPFHILNSGSHEPLQGDASSDFGRNFSRVIYRHLISTSVKKLHQLLPDQTTRSGPSCAVIRRREASGGGGGSSGGSVGGGHSGECRLWPSVLLLTSASSDLRQQPNGVEYTAAFSQHCHRRSLLAARTFPELSSFNVR